MKIQSRIKKHVDIRQFMYEVDDIRVDFGTTKFTDDGDILSIDNGGIYNAAGDRVCEFQIYGESDELKDFRRFAVNIEYVHISYIKYIFEALDAILKKEFDDVEEFDYERRYNETIERARLEAEQRALLMAEMSNDEEPEEEPVEPVEE